MEKNEDSTEPNRSKEASSEPTREAKESTNLTGNVSKSFVKKFTIHIKLFQSGEKKIKIFFYFFTLLFRGGELQVYKIKPFLFLFMLCFLATTKTLFKTNKKKYLRCPR